MENHESGYDFNARPRIIENLVQNVVIDYNKIPYDKFFYAIGRLSDWASHNDRYKFVVIAPDHYEGDLIALYYESKEDRDAGKRPNYIIGAIWRKDSKKYTFHS